MPKEGALALVHARLAAPVHTHQEPEPSKVYKCLASIDRELRLEWVEGALSPFGPRQAASSSRGETVSAENAPRRAVSRSSSR
jgi:hypothetical protein